MKILFTGGGTAGHIIPIIAIIRELKKNYSKEDFQFFYIGPKDNFSSKLFKEEDIKIKYILAGKIRNEFSIINIFQNFIDIFLKTPIGIIQSFIYIFFLNPDLIFSKGGFGSVPPVLAGKILFTPIFLHESDIIPGKANKFLSKFALEIFTSFPKTEYFSAKKMILVGNPIREKILKGREIKAKKILKLTEEKPVILILGGSQGAQRINNKILEILPIFLKDFEVIHQCGEKNFKEVESEVKIILENNKELKKYYHLFSFLDEDEISFAYKACDLIVSRAGSGSIFEIAAVGKPSILIPLPESAQNHQIRNAYHYGTDGISIIIEEANFTPHFFLERIKYILSKPELVKKMIKKAEEFSRPQSAKIIAKYLIEYLISKQ